MTLRRWPARRAPEWALVLACVAAGSGGCGGGTAGTPEDAGVIAVTTQAARLITMRDTRTVSGTVTPLAAADFVVTAPEPCAIAELPKNEGDAVKAGDIVVRLDVPSITNEVATRQLELGEATTRAERAKAEADRLGGLFEKGLAARVQWDAARSAQSVAESNLIQVRTRADAAKALEATTIIRARFNGIVSKRWHGPGDLVTGGDTDPILRIVDPTRLQISAQVPVADATRILAGQMATAQTTAGPEPAIVALKITPSSPAAPTVDVRLNFVAPTTLPIDTAVQVDIVVDERKDVVAIPADVIQRADGATFVWVPNQNSQATRREVHVGLIINSVAQIVSGLTAGEAVIVTGIAELAEGTRITIGKT